MPKIIGLAEHKRERPTHNPHIVEKVVDGEVVKCINFDALPPQLVSRFLPADDDEKKAPPP